MRSRFQLRSAMTALYLLALSNCANPVGPGQAAPSGATSQAASSGGSAVAKLMKDRGLSEADVTAALKTYTPTGKKDEYYLFASGGHGGNLLVIGVPSMRILKYLAVFTVEPWQGYGYGDTSSKQVLA